ncbi:MAG: hypothetical protein HZA81_02815 [Candidatus Taylorbacteria bacterium]|nr:hypothetical protein [Candidatus Taylorbacteria bacterium]
MKYVPSSLFALALIALAPSFASADIIPPGSKMLERCVKFVNLADFPEISLVAREFSPGGEVVKSYRVKDGACLEKGYKFNKLSVYWTSKAEPESVVEENRVIENVGPMSGYIDEASPLSKEDIEFSLVRSPEGRIAAYKSKLVQTRADEKPGKSEFYNDPFDFSGPAPASASSSQATTSLMSSSSPVDVSPAKSQAKAGLWQKILCFIGLRKSC